MRILTLRRSRVALIACLTLAPPLASQDQARATGGVGLSVRAQTAVARCTYDSRNGAVQVRF
jgi:hypothetical protein